MTDRAEVVAALDPVFSALEADGFALQVQETEGGYDLTVTATSADCEDCLVPKPVLERMIYAALEGEDGVPELRLHYPGEPAG